MEFRILGPLRVLVDGRRLRLGGPRQQTVLSCLLLDANRPIAAERLVQAIYGEAPPTTSRNQLQIAVSALRRLFADQGHPGIITTQAWGYAIAVDSARLDSHRFQELVGRAREARDTGRPAESIVLYREALALWRGPVLDGIQFAGAKVSAGRLEELRITANEECVEVELESGGHHELIGELATLVREHPMRERLHGQFMLALYRSGRREEALRAYQRARDIMIDELGIEPEERLRRLRHAILTSDAALDLPVAPAGPSPVIPAGPCLLPTDIADFTGRQQEIADLEAVLAADTAPPAVPIVVIAGMPGVGKSSFVIHASHRLADRYPGGRLYADLHGEASCQVSPMQVLERFLRALGVPGIEIPEDLEERAKLYRKLLDGRRTLIVLDDAVTESQVLPLLPDSGGCAVLITSRTRLTGLHGAHHVHVDVFDAHQSMSLLARIAGDGRVRSETRSAEAMAELCGRLPLALRIAGARLSARPHWSVEQLLRRLEDENRRLDELRHGGLGIRATISLTYESVGDDARRLLRRLAILDTPVFSGWVATALLDVPITESEDLLDELADAQLIAATAAGGGPHGQYRLHGLVRVFARERLAAEESAAGRATLLRRVLGALLALAEEAHRRAYGGPYVQVRNGAERWPLPPVLVDRLMAAPHVWFERERTSLVSAVRQAAHAGFTELCWGLALGSVSLFESRMYLDDWRDTHRIALAAAQRAGDVRGRAAALYSIGSLAIHEQRFDDARRNLETAVALFQQVGDEHATALAVRNIAFLNRVAGRLDEAATGYEAGLEIFRRTGDPVASAYILHNLAQIRLDRGEFDEADKLLAEALVLSREAGARRVEAQVLHRMGGACLSFGDPRRAAELFAQALVRVQGDGDLVGEAYALQGLGLARLRLSEPAEAGEVLRRALRSATSTGARLVETRILLSLGELALDGDDMDQAARHLRSALELARGIQAAHLEARIAGVLDTVRSQEESAGL
ncbi:AfsR/SARP family transcriptional regulator [Streptosporangium sp. KLBMP 9127]|nr:tetratricopeptide repeat protein [Streptosporangium sp. KLBMP 9127]